MTDSTVHHSKAALHRVQTGGTLLPDAVDTGGVEIPTATSTSAQPNAHLSPGVIDHGDAETLTAARYSLKPSSPMPPGAITIDGAEFSTVTSPATATTLLALVETYRVRTGLMTAAGDMMRRIKSKERGSAVHRLRAMGKAPSPGKMPATTKADAAVVRAAYPAFHAALDVLQEQQKLEEKALLKAVAPLPIMAWAVAVRGLGPLSVATLIAEAVDPGRYATPSRLWKRYGLAVIDGGRQRLVAGEGALAHGYNPQRRAALYLIGENLIRTGNVEARAIYDRAKAAALAKEGVTKMHAHRHGLRIAQKKLALAFWLAWRQLERGEPLSDAPRAFMTPTATRGAP